jgi:hypothetical protein
MSIKKGLLLVILMAVIVGIWQLLYSPSTETASEVSQVRMVSLFGYNNRAEKTWIINAETGKMDDVKDSELFNVSVRLLSDNADDVVATCDSLNYLGDEAIMKGSVNLAEKDGIRLVTDEAIWNTKGSEISAWDVTISVQSISLVAPVFTYQTDKRRAEISGGVRATIAGSSPMVVNSNQADADKDSIHMNGDVRVQVREEIYAADALGHSFSTDMTVLSGEVVGTFSNGHIFAEELVIHEDKIEARGGVKIDLREAFFGESDGA